MYIRELAVTCPTFYLLTVLDLRISTVPAIYLLPFFFTYSA